MSRPFAAGAPHSRQADEPREVHDWKPQVDQILGGSEGVLRAIIAPRRRGKTWALRALEQRFQTPQKNDSFAANEIRTSFHDLRDRPLLSDFSSAIAEAVERDEPYVALLDEPCDVLADSATTETFIKQCRQLNSGNAPKHIVLALTPKEWCGLHPVAGHRVYERDLIFLEPLTNEEVDRMAARTTRATALRPHLPPEWTRQPYLLELLFEMWERHKTESADDLGTFFGEIVELACDPPIDISTRFSISA